MMRSVLVMLLITVGLSGCGGPPKAQAGPPPPLGVYTSAVDCADSKKLPLTQCDQLIQSAVNQHNQTAKNYISSRLCELTEGEDRCERTSANSFRPKLLAFLVTFSQPPLVQPLYAAADKGALGFSTSDKSKTVLAVDETLLFSPAAKIVAEGNQ